MQEGGAYLGEGTYGCAFKPALKCKGKTRRSPNTISKLMYKNEALKEYKTKELLERVNRDGKYYLYPKELCEVNASLFEPGTNNVESCSKEFYGPNSARIIEYPYGGNDLSKIMLHPSEYIAFFNGFANIFAAVERLHRNNMAHLDIKPGNLVALKKADGTFDFRMIDFGFLTKVNDKERIMGLPLIVDYYIWPYDIKFCSMRKKKRGFLRNTIQTFTKDDITLMSVVKFKDVAMNHLRNRVPQYIYDGITELTDEEFEEIYTLVDKENNLNERLDLILKGADVYSLAITLGELYYKFTKHIMVQRPTGEYKFTMRTEGYPLSHRATIWNSDVASKITKPLFRLIALMMDPDPRERIKITDAKNVYNTILLEINRYFIGEQVRAGLKEFVRFSEAPMAAYVSNAETMTRKALVTRPPSVMPNNVAVAPVPVPAAPVPTRVAPAPGTPAATSLSPYSRLFTSAALLPGTKVAPPAPAAVPEISTNTANIERLLNELDEFALENTGSTGSIMGGKSRKTRKTNKTRKLRK